MEDANGRSKLKELENVITEFQDQLFRFAFYRTGCFAESQDIVQEVFVKLYNENGRLATICNIRLYLFKSIANACIDYQRKNEKSKFETLDKAIIPNNINEKDASHEMVQREEYHRIEALLQKLPEEQAETIRLRVLDDLSFTDIATILNIPVSTTKSRFKYGIDKLKSKVFKLKEVYYGL